MYVLLQLKSYSANDIFLSVCYRLIYELYFIFVQQFDRHRVNCLSAIDDQKYVKVFYKLSFDCHQISLVRALERLSLDFDRV